LVCCVSRKLGVKMADVCRKHGISPATFDKWKTRFGGLGVSDVARLQPEGSQPVLNTGRKIGGQVIG
jgi:hypothetical protein